MKDSNETIETVLAALRNAEPPAGIERRMLIGVEGRASARSLLSWRRPWPLWLATQRPRASFSMAVAIALAVLAVIAITTHHHDHIVDDTQALSAANSPVSGRLPPASLFAGLREGHGFSRAASPRQCSRALALASAPASAPASAREVRLLPAERTSPADARDTQTQDAAYAASVPTPPMPLTEQERLLLQIAHRRDPANLAVLNPALLETQIARDSAQFQEFFAHPPVKADPANVPIDNPPPQDAQVEDDAAQSPEPAVQPTLKKR
jgi:hypothetical protein